MRRIQAEGGTSAFSWVADPSSRLVVTATTSRWTPRNPSIASSVKGQMRRTERGWDPSFFWQFVNSTHGAAYWLKRVVPLERVQRFRRVRPLVAGGTPCRPFLLPAGDRTRNGRHYFLWRFSYSSQESTWSTLRRSQGRDHQTSGDEIPGVFFLGPRRSYAVCGWKCGWKIRSIWERGPEQFQNVLLDLIPAVTLSVLNSS